ncbi:hypothetical protein [Streptomyces sp. NPDC001770]
MRDRYVGVERRPASSAVRVVAPYRPELVMEAEAFAVIPGDRVTR